MVWNRHVRPKSRPAMKKTAKRQPTRARAVKWKSSKPAVPISLRNSSAVTITPMTTGTTAFSNVFSTGFIPP